MEMTFSQLDAGDQKLLKLMQTIDYGRLEQFSICNGHVVATSKQKSPLQEDRHTDNTPSPITAGWRFPSEREANRVF